MEKITQIEEGDKFSTSKGEFTIKKVTPTFLPNGKMVVFLSIVLPDGTLDKLVDAKLFVQNLHKHDGERVRTIETASKAYMRNLSSIQAKIRNIQEFVDDAELDFEVDGNNWGRVGSIAEVNTKLGQIVSFMTGYEDEN